ncbi:MAG: helical backbone metal receptor [Salegentibacter sp.]|uniref:ABC transporter substrate-binding protein n=1 Tax=Salegentibacter sp. TaxID=1903072 RepID=UPI0028703EB5|nr:helical backbone metal receptor [Salegentibacter sp.]MDR9456791.1 helical backbone metal receptor [Salegentibacter sp.]
MELWDQLQRKIVLDGVPQRVVSLVPSQTELLIDLGLEKTLVGVTKFCVHPIYLLNTKKIVGGTKQVHIDRIKNLQPDLILCNKEENTPEIVEALEKIAPVHVSDINEIDDAFEMMLQYGQIFNKEEFAKTMVKSIKDKISALKEINKGKPTKKAAYLIWKKPLMVAGKNTFIDTLLQLNNFENVFEDERYPVTNLEELKAKKPDLILLSSEPYPFSEKHIEFFGNTGAEIKLVDGEYFSWYGSRLLGAMDYFKNLNF